LWSSWFIVLLPWSKSSIVISSFKSQQTWVRLILGSRIPLNFARVRITTLKPRQNSLLSWTWPSYHPHTPQFLYASSYYGLLVGGSCIFQPEWHNLVAECFSEIDKVFFSLSSKDIFIWLYHKKLFMKECMELRAALSTKTSICDNGKSSLGLTLFKSLKSTHNLIFLSFFNTTTIIDTHCGYLTTSKNSAFHYFSISYFTFIRMFEWILLNFYLTGLYPFTSCILCTLISVSKPSIFS